MMKSVEMSGTDPPSPRRRSDARELELLLELTQATSEARDLEDALRHVLEKICVATGWRYGESWLVQGPGAPLERGPGWHREGADLRELGEAAAGAALPSDGGLPRMVCTARAVVWGDVRSDGGHREAAAIRLGLHAVVGVPILTERECMGAVLFYVPRRTEDADRAVMLVSVATAQLGVWLKRKRAEDAVRASEQRFRLLVEHIGDAVFMLGTDGHVETWTPAAERMFGFAGDEIIGSKASVFSESGAARDANLDDELAEARSMGRRESDAWRVRKDGTRFWAHVVTCPMRSDAGQITGYAEVVRDLTAVRAAEQATQQHARDLARSNRELEEFASIASHDLQEPLRKILAFGDRLRTRCAGSLDERGEGYLERLQDAARRMQQLVDDLLAYSRLASRNHPFQEVDLAAIVGEVLRDLESRVEQKKARIEIFELPTVQGDPTQLRQLLQNLLSNGLKFHAEGEVPKIRVSSRLAEPRSARSPARWEIAIEDQGIGFDEKYLDRIFGMLQRLHGRSEYEGTGMGLAICRRIAERHQGEITAHSRPGQGATFVVTLPETPREADGGQGR